MKKIFGLFLKGIIIGGTLTIPGVSGGSMAIILGVYENMVQAVNVLIGRGGKKKEAFGYLLIIALGGMLGLFAASAPILMLLERYPMQMIFLFAGAVAGGIPMLWKESKAVEFKWSHLLYAVLGLAIVIFIMILPDGLFTIAESRNWAGIFMQLIGGFIAAIALVLPGISVSHILYVFGIYNGIMAAITRMDLWVLIPFAVGGALGIVLTARVVDRMMVQYRAQAYMVILGFVLGSVAELLGSGLGFSFSLVCIPFFIIGYCSIYLISKQKAANS